MTDKERAIIREFLPSILFVPRFGQKLGRYIAAQSLTRLATQKPPQTLRLAGVPGAGNVTRTHDLLITNQLLYRLSYASIFMRLDYYIE